MPAPTPSAARLASAGLPPAGASFARTIRSRLRMNTRGNPKRLVAAQPRNLNALKQRVHSPRLIQARAAEIASELTRSFEFSPAERLAAHEAARCSGSPSVRLQLRPQATD